MHFVPNDAVASTDADVGGALATVQVTLVPAGMSAIVNAARTEPDWNVVVCPRSGPPGLTLLARPGSTSTAMGFGL